MAPRPRSQSGRRRTRLGPRPAEPARVPAFSREPGNRSDLSGEVLDHAGYMTVTLTAGDGMPLAITSILALPVSIVDGTAKLVVPTTLVPIARVEWLNVRQ